MHYMLQCNKLLLLTYAPTIGSFDTARKEISQGKSFCMEKSSLHRMLYSCSHMATLDVKDLVTQQWANVFNCRTYTTYQWIQSYWWVRVSSGVALAELSNVDKVCYISWRAAVD